MEFSMLSVKIFVSSVGTFCLSLLLLVGLMASPVLAAGRPPMPGDVWQGWNFSPMLLAGLILGGWLYGRGVLALRARTGHLRPQHRRRMIYFGLGMFVLAVALVSPLDALSSALFSAHMVQHVLLIGVAAPLLVLGLPLGPMLLGLPGTLEQQLGRGWQRSRVFSTLWHALTLPLVAWGLHAAALWIWHLPGLYEAALTSEWLHTVEHLTFLGTALLLWWVVVDRGRRAQTENWLLPMGMLFTTAIHSGILGVLMSFARQPWYPIYSVTTAPWGLTPLADQQLAGVIMWVPTGFIYLGGTLALLYRLINRTEESDRLTRLSNHTLSALLMVGVLFSTAGCFVGPPSETISYKVPEGDPQRGWYLVQEHGCPACHTIPEVPGADTEVGPPLTDWASRRYIAGKLVNTPENLIAWLENPQAIEPGTAMPYIPMSDQDILDIAAYLFVLGYD